MLRDLATALVGESPLLFLPLLALVLFFGIFVGVLVHLGRRRAATYASVERLPLEDAPLANVGVQARTPAEAPSTMERSS